jgi:hypothetical protein
MWNGGYLYMGKIKTGLLAAGGVAIGVVTLRKLRNRNSDETAEEATVSEPVEDTEAAVEDTDAYSEEPTEEVVEAKGEAITAVKHVAGAVKHGGLAVVKTIQKRRQTTDVVDPASETVESSDNDK